MIWKLGIVMVFVFLLMPVILADASNVRAMLEERHKELLDTEGVPEVIKEGLGKGKNWFEIEKLDEGRVRIKYLGELNEEGKVAEGDAGIELDTKKDSDGNPTSKMPMLKGSELIYDDGRIVEADIFTPKECGTDGQGACPLLHADGEGYQLGEYTYPVTEGSRIEYEIVEEGDEKTEKVKITIPYRGKIIAPNKIKDGGVFEAPGNSPIVEYKIERPKGDLTWTDEFLLLPGDNKVSAFGDFDYSIYYDADQKAFFVDSAVQIENLYVNALRSDKVYLYTNGEGKPLAFDGSALFLREKGGIEMLSTEGNTGYSLEMAYIPSGRDVAPKYYGKIKLDSDESYVFYVHGKGKDPEGKAFEGHSEVIINPLDGVEGKKVYVKTKGSFSHVNGNQFVHLNGNEANKGPRTYLLDKKQVIKGTQGTEINRDFSKKKSTVTQINFKDPNGKNIKHPITEGDKTTEFELKYDLFVDDANHVLFPKTEGSEKLLADTRFYDLEGLEVKKEAIELLNEGNSVEKIFAGENFADNLKKAAGGRAAKIAAEEKVRQDALQSNVPAFLKNVPIGDDFVAGLDATARNPLYRGNINKRHQGDSDVVALVLNDHGCPGCVQWMNGVSNPNGNVYEMKDSKFLRGYIQNNYKMDLSSLREMTVHTIFIDTKAKAVIGYETGYTDQRTFNSYFN